MFYYFEQPINTETANALVDKLQNEDNIDLFFSTTGGNSDAMDFIISFLNSKQNVTIHLIDRLISAGTNLLLYFKGKIVIEDSLDFIVFHLSDREVYTLRNDPTGVNEKILLKQTNDHNIKFYNDLKAKNFLTEKQLKNFLKEVDVVVYKEQFKKWDLNK